MNFITFKFTQQKLFTVKNLKKLLRNDLKTLKGGGGDSVCGMTVHPAKLFPCITAPAVNL